MKLALSCCFVSAAAAVLICQVAGKALQETHPTLAPGSHESLFMQAYTSVLVKKNAFKFDIPIWKLSTKRNLSCLASGLFWEETSAAANILELTAASTTNTDVGATTEEDTTSKHQEDLISTTSSRNAFSPYTSEVSKGKSGSGGDSSVACCSASIFMLNSGIEWSVSAIQTAAVNVSEGEQANDHEDVCCDERIVELLHNVSTKITVVHQSNNCTSVTLAIQ
jgi:hypothetical protein